MALIVVLLMAASTPAGGETVTGTLYQDLDHDGIQGPEEPGVAGARVLAYDSEGRVLAQGVSGEDGTYRLSIEPAETEIRVTVAGLGGRLAVRAEPPESLEGSPDQRRIDLRLVEVAQLEREQRSSFGVSGRESTTKGSLVYGGDLPGGLLTTKALDWITLRCAGPNGVFDVDPEVDDRAAPAYPIGPGNPRYSLGARYEAIGFLPQVGERCRIYLPGESGHLEDAPPPPPPPPPPTPSEADDT